VTANGTVKRRIPMLMIIILILIVLWLLGFLGPRASSRIPKTGNLVHVLLVIAVILIILKLLGMI
jgi:amino acid transporter